MSAIIWLALIKQNTAAQCKRTVYNPEWKIIKVIDDDEHSRSYGVGSLGYMIS